MASLSDYTSNMIKKHKGKKRLEQVKQALRQPYTWPGGYPIQFVTYDGCMCHKCVRADFRAVVTDTKMGVGGWNVTPEPFFEGLFFCVECGEQLETAYGPSLDEIEA